LCFCLSFCSETAAEVPLEIVELVLVEAEAVLEVLVAAAGLAR